MPKSEAQKKRKRIDRQKYRNRKFFGTSLALHRKNTMEAKNSASLTRQVRLSPAKDEWQPARPPNLNLQKMQNFYAMKSSPKKKISKKPVSKASSKRSLTFSEIFGIGKERPSVSEPIRPDFGQFSIRQHRRMCAVTPTGLIPSGTPRNPYKKQEIENAQVDS